MATDLQKQADELMKKPHISMVVVGHVDSGKSTTTGHLLFKLGNINARDMDKLKALAEAEGKASFAFAYLMDNTKEERARGVTIQTTAKSFSTDNYFYTIIDCPGHKDFIKNMISGAGQADCGCMVIPCDSGFVPAVRKPDRAQNIIQGQCRQHARLLYLLGVNQVILLMNKMDAEGAEFKQSRYEECRNESINMLIQCGFSKEQANTCTPCIPLSGYHGHNLLEKSSAMPWYTGQTMRNVCFPDEPPATFHTLVDCFDNWVRMPKRNVEGPLRAPITGVCKIKGIGTVYTAKIEQGRVTTTSEVCFLPQHCSAVSCQAKVFSIEMHHVEMASAKAGDNIGMCLRGLDPKNPAPASGSLMIEKKDVSMFTPEYFRVSAVLLDIPKKINTTFKPLIFSRCGSATCVIVKMISRQGKETGKLVAYDQNCAKSGDRVDLIMKPEKPLMVMDFGSCPNLARIALFDSSEVRGLGRVTAIYKKDCPVLKEILDTPAGSAPPGSAPPTTAPPAAEAAKPSRPPKTVSAGG